MTPRAQEATDLITATPGRSRREIAALMGCSLKTAQQHLMAAKAAGTIRADGRGCDSKWWPGPAVRDLERRPVRRVSCVWELAA